MKLDIPFRSFVRSGLAASCIMAATASGTPPAAAAPTTAAPAVQKAAMQSYGKLPLSFEVNRGQTDRRVKFLSRGPGYTLFLTNNEAVLSLRKEENGTRGAIKLRAQSPRHPGPDAHRLTPDTRVREGVLRLKLLGANQNPQVSGADELPGKASYFMGKDPKNWHTNLATYGKVQYHGVYPGIDLSYYGNQRQLEYDWIVSPGADPGKIRMSFEGASRLKLDQEGNLMASLGAEQVGWHKPVVYQEVDGKRQPIEGRYVLEGKDHVRFRVARYDRRRPLVIDPVLAYSTYLGGDGEDRANAVAVDSSGNAYVAGYTGSNFPTTAGAFQTAHASDSGGDDVFVSKLNATGTALVYSTYLGGNGYDFAYGLAVDSSGNAYVAGQTDSTNFPTTPGAFQTVLNASQSNAFVSKLNATGTALVYSTYLGGNNFEDTACIAVDSSGNAYVAGVTQSTNFPTTTGAFQTTFGGGGSDAFVTKLNATGTALVYSTYLGGNSAEYAQCIALDASGNACVAGYTASTNFPTTAGDYQPAHASDGGTEDAFVSKLDATGTALIYSTCLGGNGDDRAYGIALDASGNAYVAGVTASTNFPTTSGSFQATFGGNYDAFVSKLNATGTTLIYSTYLGGNNYDQPYGIAVDFSGDAYVAGRTSSTNFPATVGAFQTTIPGGAGHYSYSAFVSKLNANGTVLVYSTYVGGDVDDYGQAIAVDASGNAYTVGFTISTNFPTTTGAFQTAHASDGGGKDAFVSKFAVGSPVVATTAASNLNSTGTTLTGTVDPNGTDTTVQFQWGPTTSYGSTTSAIAVPAAGGITGVQSILIDLTPNTTYHFRITGSSSMGTSTGADQVFTTSASPPQITGFTATSGKPGDLILVNGSYFTGANGATIGGVNVTTFSVYTDTQIALMVPAGAQTGLITVTTPVGTGQSASSFTVTTAGLPQFTPSRGSCFSPTSAKVGAYARIMGSNFTGTTSVTFGGVSASFSINSNYQITVIIPAGAATGKAVVTNAAGSATSPNSFTVQP